MSITIDSTVGGASANSFVLLAEADSYMESRLNASTWDSADPDNQNRALAEATRYLSALGWQGRASSSTQALAWPRDWVVNPDDPNLDYFSNAAIPTRIKNATCELAFQFIKAGATDLAALDPKVEIQRSQVDVLVTDYVAYGRRQGLARYPSVYRLIAPLLDGAMSGPFLRTVAG